jgi:SAM-dependent methyltransferase
MGAADLLTLEDEADRADLSSFGMSEDGAEALLEREARADEQAFLDAVRRFSDAYLPCRGWYQMLDVGAGAGTRAILLAERGYAVTVVQPAELALRFVQHRFERRGLHGDFLHLDRLDEVPGRFDAAFCFDPTVFELSPASAAAALRPRLRARGLLLGGPGFASGHQDLRPRGFSSDRALSGEFAALRVQGRLGRILARFPVN